MSVLDLASPERSSKTLWVSFFVFFSPWNLVTVHWYLKYAVRNTVIQLQNVFFPISPCCRGYVFFFFFFLLQKSVTNWFSLGWQNCRQLHEDSVRMPPFHYIKFMLWHSGALGTWKYCLTAIANGNNHTLKPYSALLTHKLSNDAQWEKYYVVLHWMLYYAINYALRLVSLQVKFDACGWMMVHDGGLW